MLCAPCGHCAEGLKGRGVEWNDAVLLGFGVFTFEGYKLLLDADALQTKPQ